MANLLILGASRGLGAALVEGLPRKGDAVFGLSRSEPAWLRRNSHEPGWRNLTWVVRKRASIENRSPSAPDCRRSRAATAQGWARRV